MRTQGEPSQPRLLSVSFIAPCLAPSVCLYATSSFVPFLDQGFCLLDKPLNPFAFHRFTQFAYLAPTSECAT